MATGAQPTDEGPSAPLPTSDFVNSHFFDEYFAPPSFNHDVSPKAVPEITTAQRREDLFDHVMNKISSAGTSTTIERLKQDLLKTFFDQITACKYGVEDEERTILHWIAHKIKFERIRESDPKFKAAGLLAEIATSMDPKMLSLRDTEKKSTPIHMLISCAKSSETGIGEIILAMCRAAEKDSPEGKKYASEAISMQNKDNENCLHMAIKKELSITKDLITLASAQAVVAVCSIDGNTPLHDAVGPNRFAYRKQVCGANPRPCEKCQAIQAQMDRSKGRVMKDIVALIVKNPKALRSKNKEDLSPYLLHKQSREPVRPAAPTNKSSLTLMDKDDSIRGLGDTGKQKCKTVPSNDLDEEIERYLVESAFDLGGFEEACDCFFGDKTHLKGKDSVFRPERPLSGLDSDNMYPFFNCGTTLAQVDLSIDPTDSKGSAASNDTIQVEDARIALSRIFEMLKKKNVKRILKLKVRDNTKTPCSDDFIENCLRPFDIRYLDWNKPDLCADVVIRSTPRVTGLWLYATGNNAVLRSWAGSNGLSNLLQLRSVHVQSKVGLESYSNHLAAVGAFKRDLRASIEVVRKLKIMAMGQMQHQTIMGQYKSYSDNARQHLQEVQSPLEPSQDKQLWQARLEWAEAAMAKGEAIGTKLTAGVTMLLQRKEANLQDIINRLGLQQQPQDQKKAPTDEIDISELQQWGIQSLGVLESTTNFVALRFRAESKIDQPVTGSGHKLTKKSSDKYDDSSCKPHQWVESLERFVSDHVQRSDRGARVKVGLIDDGVDVHLGDLKDKVKAGWPTEKPTSSRVPFYQSAEGHGTTMARLIATACPHVDLYVAKLESLNRVILRDEPGKLIDNANRKDWISTADEAASAIKWAREQKVDIISMSWSFIATTQNQAHLERLTQELQSAANEHIILYCAAADQGMYGSRKSLYPANAGANIKVVGSATETGHSSSFVNQGLVDYLFPGEEIKGIGNRKGSSAATALAAGFAALVIWCHEVHFKSNPEKRAWIKKAERMDSLFQGMQNLATKPDAPQSGWVDASLVLDEGDIKQVIDFVDREVKRGVSSK
ncbi:uncharacterized protein NECHADRAFT_77386 [Fusarium vanettenii 77-13-4]|uniref:Peptidase S8/S53 domain-containing protein n=1 Tax=Fusarium vanettenii (strain ATCC MYA-4622 / CBS 123669 / FGSC 9596 / NRRL 45880 / 77-13-4) TaxID=660122 RepID=C7YL33_FUSV7|nr:uncharacterized protein NECHADRAFT_77386 [Fusarium vanettenii 77-13-4]EEU47184.1 hypothetical protein NECHADRAFT_77386 [Fusarium vanettenii 77-13-4]